MIRHIGNWFGEKARALSSHWNRFWFTPADPINVAVMRIGVALVSLYVHAAATPELLEQIGPRAWIDQAAIEQIRDLGRDTSQGMEGLTDGWWGHSVWFYVQDPVAIYALHGVFLIAIVWLLLGQCSRTANVVVWLFHLSYVHRSLLTWYGMDSIMLMLLFYLQFAPTGACLSLDRYWRDRRAPTGRLQRAGCEPSWTANLVVRMIQVHMCVVYFCAGASKLRGARWWDGTAVWITMNLEEFSMWDISWLAHWGDVPCLLVSSTGVLLTLFVELAFVFLIWQRGWRPVMLALAAVLHAGIALFMSLGAFQSIMLVGVSSFIAPEVLRRQVDRASRGWARLFQARSSAERVLPASAARRSRAA